jgi:hypothetical protein
MENPGRPPLSLPLKSGPEYVILNQITNHHHHHHWQNSPFWAIAFLIMFCQISSGFHLFGFRNIFFFTEQGRQPCVQPPIWKTRSLYLCSPVTVWPSYTPRHRVHFSSSFFAPQGYGGGILTRLHTRTDGQFSIQTRVHAKLDHVRTLYSHLQFLN